MQLQYQNRSPIPWVFACFFDSLVKIRVLFTSSQQVHYQAALLLNQVRKQLKFENYSGLCFNVRNHFNDKQ